LKYLFSFVYFQVGTETTDTSLSISHQGAITLLAVNAMFSNSQIMMLSFPMERPVFLREHAAGWYGVSALEAEYTYGNADTPDAARRARTDAQNAARTADVGFGVGGAMVLTGAVVLWLGQNP
jgi:hypothetical protein